MRTLLICHEEDELNRVGLARWLASFSTLAGIVSLRETSVQTRRRIKRELRRVGPARFLDVLAFRAYYRARWAGRDREWEERTLAALRREYPELPEATAVLTAASPNTSQVREFIQTAHPDMVIARCKVILKEEIFSVPTDGTFVMHPGICPEYRNAHGCFWALANRDLERVGMTLLRVDRGVDTGPIFGYFRAAYDERRESHIVIQHRTVFDNLDAIRDRLLEIHAGRGTPIEVANRASGAWGQPWLSSYVRWRRAVAK